MDAPAIGKLIDATAGRDAIHVAIAPAVAEHTLRPGEHVSVEDGDKATAGSILPPVGIVDPFLAAAVKRGQRFYVFLYPNTVTSLRHEWTHPAFGEAVPGTAAPAADDTSDKAKSERWIAAFADELDMTAPALMHAAERYLDMGMYHTFHGYDTPDAAYTKSSEFWRHYEIVTGRHVNDSDKASFFSCSC